MAKKKDKNVENKSTKNKNKKNDKPGIGTRINNFFRSLGAEIKKVVWPDKPTVFKTTVTVLVIVLLVTLLVFIVDSIMVFVLDKLGFNTAQTTVPSSNPAPAIEEDVDAVEDGEEETDPSDEEGSEE